MIGATRTPAPGRVGELTAVGPFVLGFDPSWGGLGWCLAQPSGPLEFGWVSLERRTWRWAALVELLAGLDQLLIDYYLGATIPAQLRIAVERAPAVYASRGNQAATGYGLGLIAGPILTWGTRPRAWGYPWELETDTWRAWWEIGKGGRRWDRAAYKRGAVFYATGLLGKRRGELDALDFTPETGEGARADVAEAILIAVGAARNLASAPKGPKDWTRVAGPATL